MINHLIVSTIDKIQIILEHGGYWILAVVAVFEGLPLIGTIIPGQTVIVIAGFFTRLGVLNPWLVIIIAAVGAMIGDLIGYEIGKRYGMRFIERFGQYVLIKPHHVERARQLIDSHTGKSIIIGRFTAITRSLIPFIAGSMNIHKGKFWFYNIIGSISWSVASVALGYVFGASYEVAAQYFGRFAMVGVILAALLLFAYHYVNKNRHIFAKYQLTALLVSITSLLVFFRLVEDALSKKSFLAHLDVWVSRLVVNSQTASGVTSAELISHIFSPTTLAFSSVILLAWAIHRRLRQVKITIKSGLNIGHDALVILFSYPIGTIGGYILKAIVERERPYLAIVKAGGYSFPSGHAVAGSIFFSLLIYFAFKYVRNSFWREICISASILMAISVALARVYLNVHWLTDVVAGLALGAFVVAFVVLVLRYVQAMLSKRKAREFKV